MRIALLIVVVALTCVALGVQVYHARAYAANATRSVKIVWGLNIGLLVVLLVGLVAYVVVAGVL